MLNKDYQAAAEITKDTAGNYDYKFLCDLHPGFRSEIMDMSATKIVNRLDVKESYAQSLQHYAYLSYANERIKQLNKTK
jgi:hypothetical protein